jgi:hypothetical protein
VEACSQQLWRQFCAKVPTRTRRIHREMRKKSSSNFSEPTSLNESAAGRRYRGERDDGSRRLRANVAAESRTRGSFRKYLNSNMPTNIMYLNRVLRPGQEKVCCSHARNRTPNSAALCLRRDWPFCFLIAAISFDVPPNLYRNHDTHRKRSTQSTPHRCL